MQAHLQILGGGGKDRQNGSGTSTKGVIWECAGILRYTKCRLSPYLRGNFGNMNRFEYHLSTHLLEQALPGTKDVFFVGVKMFAGVLQSR